MSADCDIHSMAETLIRFIGSLGEPVVPYRLYKNALAVADNPAESKRVVMQLGRTHRNVFVYLTGFLREVLRHSAHNGLTAQDLGTLAGHCCWLRLIPCVRSTVVWQRDAPFAASVP